MGASGDMFMAALYDLLPDKDAFRERMDRLGLPGVTFEYSSAEKCGITGTRIAVKICGAEEKSEDIKGGDSPQAVHSGKRKNHLSASLPSGGKQHSHHHGGHRHGFEEIRGIIRGLGLPDNVLEDALGVYSIIGEAEALVHGVPLSAVHLHEIGALDAVADIVGCCLLINMLGVTDIVASPVHVGFGAVQCEHGILPVPAPAAAEILKGIPIYGGRIEGELCTPTGAALLKHFVTSFGDMPPLTVVKIGYGMGAKDFEAANCLRAYLCEDDASDGGERGAVYEISCNLDDMTPEAVGAAFDVLFENGALDVYVTPIMMKKSRPGVILSCLGVEGDRDKLARSMLKHTSTLGVRITACSRDVLARTEDIVPTKYGDIRIKSARGFGLAKQKPEFDDVLEAAKRHGKPFMAVHDEALRAAKIPRKKEK